MNEKIVLENLNLIYKVMKDLNCNMTREEEIEEYWFAGLCGLIDASKVFDETKGKSTYLYKSIRNRIFNVFYKNTRPKRYAKIKPISLNVKVNDYKIDNELIDYIPDNYDFEKEFIAKEYVKYLLSKLKDTQYKRFLIEYYGIGVPPLNMHELGRKYGVRYQNVQQQIKRGLVKLREVIENENKEINSKTKTKI